MGKMVDKLKAERRAERMNDPHAWAYEIESRLDSKSVFASLALLVSLGIGWYAYDLRKEVDLLQAQVLSLQTSTRPVAQLASGDLGCAPVIGPSGQPSPAGYCR